MKLSAAILNFYAQDETFTRNIKLSPAISNSHAQAAVFAKTRVKTSKYRDKKQPFPCQMVSPPLKIREVLK
jgi:hypothetical protein